MENIQFLILFFVQRFYYVASNTKFTENDYQPQELRNELIEDSHNIDHIYPKVIPLMSSKEKLKCRKVLYDLQFYVLSHAFFVPLF